jgi:hypothetical protein
MSGSPTSLAIDVREERLVALDAEFRGVPAYALDVPETIPQLGYGSHQFFRYYGKFPSVVGREIVRRNAGAGCGVLDCYAGCGTTLVEAQNAGHPSFGVDINPLGVLASNVKTAYPDAGRLRAMRDSVVAEFEGQGDSAELPEVPQSRLDKWFSDQTQRELSGMRQALFSQPPGLERSFLVLAYLGIVRRVSRAYDGEVRPHINPEKKQRSVGSAFRKKLDEMIDALPEVNELRPDEVRSRTLLGDNRDPDTYERLLGAERPGLLVAHPPYLNSFNYLQVFSLELAWSLGFEEVWPADTTLDSIRKREHRAWPATNPALTEQYYLDFRRTMGAAVNAAASDARVAVVIGDATIKGELEPVHERFWDILCELSLEPVEVWYRSTHYGIGKYAYSHRADYHGDAEKRDAVLLFRRS